MSTLLSVLSAIAVVAGVRLLRRGLNEMNAAKGGGSRLYYLGMTACGIAGVLYLAAAHLFN